MKMISNGIRLRKPNGFSLFRSNPLFSPISINRPRSCSTTAAISADLVSPVSMAPSLPLLGPSEFQKASSPPPRFTTATCNKSQPPPPSQPTPYQPPVRGFTENNSPTLMSTGNPCLDFFFHIVPDTPKKSLIRRLELAWKHDPLTTLKLVCNLRGVRGTGKSDKEGFYTAALWLHKNHPKTLAYNVKSFSQFGYFKDLPEILYRLLEGPDRSKLKPWYLRKVDDDADSKWVKLATDPATGCVYYYNESTRTSQWVSSSENTTLPESITSIPLPPDFELAPQKGPKYFYNRKTDTFHHGCLKCGAHGYYIDLSESGLCKTCSRKNGKSLGVSKEARLAAEAKKVELEKEIARKIRKKKEMEEARKEVERYCSDADLRCLHDQVSQLFADHLSSDLKTMNVGKVGISLASKWCPSLDSSFDRATLLCESIAKRVFQRDSYNEYQDLEEGYYAYRVRDRLRKELLVPLRQTLQLPEIYMSSNSWNILPYNRVASVAMTRYKELFLEHDEQRFKEYLGMVKTGKAKIAAGALLPHQIIQSLYEDDGEVAELQWKRMVEDLSSSGKLKNCIGVCDVSGSMHGKPMDVCVALGLLLSELSEEPWKGNVITFSQQPQLHKIEGDNLKSKAQFIQEMEWGMNTDFQRVFDAILQVAIAGKLNPDMMIRKVFVFSDMEFDEARKPSSSPYLYRQGRYVEIDAPNSGDGIWDTDYEVIKKKFEEYGYRVPEIVFWNLRDSKATPVLCNEKGVALVSGHSKNMVKIFLNEDEIPSPESVMHKALVGREYQELVVVD